MIAIEPQKLPEQNPLVFCFPYRGVGGVSLLFLRIAEYLIQHYNYPVFVIDYPDGFIARNLSDRRVQLLHYSDDQKVTVPVGAILILQAMSPWSIFPMLAVPPATKILFWVCHPFNLVPVLPGAREFLASSKKIALLLLATMLRPYRNRMRRFVQAAIDCSSLVFMDKSSVSNTAYHLRLRIDEPTYLPIPANDAKSELDIDVLTKTSPLFLTAAWVGRIVDFKFHILHYTLAKLSALSSAQRKKIHFIVVGDGPRADALRTEEYCHEYFSVECIKDIPITALDSFLVERVNLLFAMGTSALEGMKLGIPTVLLDLSYKPIQGDYRFRFADQNEGYSLGEVISNEHFVRNNTSLQEIVHQTIAGKQEISRRMMAYYKANHSIASVSERFLSCAGSAQLRWGSLRSRGLLSPGFIYSGFRGGRSWIERFIKARVRRSL